MPKNKDALFRYLCIDIRLRKSNKPSLPDIKEFIETQYPSDDKYSVALETLKKDIQTLRKDFGAPIDYARGENKYFYQHRDYSFLSLGNKTVEKLLTNLKLSQILKNTNQVKSVIQFETETSQTGWELIPDLVEAIVISKKIHFQYHSVSGKEGDQILSPYLLKENRNSWYLIGTKNGKKEVRTFSLGRMSMVKVTKEPSDKPPKTFNPSEYFSNAIGITTNDGEEQEVILSFSPKQSTYLKEKPLHSSQKILVDDKIEFRIALKVANNYELHANILSYGENVKVVKPKSIREQIIKRIKNSLENY